MVTEIASFRGKIPLTFRFHGVDSPKARGVTGFWAGLELRVKVKAVVASWAPSLRLPLLLLPKVHSPVT